MNSMLEKGKKEQHEEEVQLVAYKQFGDDTSVEKTTAIEEANTKLTVLKADIGKAVVELEEDIISIWNGDIKAEAATKVRIACSVDAFLQQDPEEILALGAPEVRGENHQTHRPAHGRVEGSTN